MYESLNLEALATKESVKVVTNVKQLHEESGDAPGLPQLQTALSGGSKIEPPKPSGATGTGDESGSGGRGGRGGCTTRTAKCKSMGIAVPSTERIGSRRGWIWERRQQRRGWSGPAAAGRRRRSQETYSETK